MEKIKKRLHLGKVEKPRPEVYMYLCWTFARMKIIFVCGVAVKKDCYPANLKLNEKKQNYFKYRDLAPWRNAFMSANADIIYNRPCDCSMCGLTGGNVYLKFQ